jgi:acyl dehydratase
VAKLYFEDFVAGSVTEYGPRLLTREQIIAFAAEFDPQPMHLDEQAARTSMVGGLCASGWHGCSLMMRMMADGFVLNSSSMGSPGVDEVQWLAPIRPGTQLTLRAHVLETRVSKSKPDRGFVKFLFELLDGSGRALITMSSSLMVARREQGAS